MESEKRDIVLRVLLTPSEFIALRDIAQSLGLSQSSCVRMWCLQKIDEHGRRIAQASEDQ